LQRDGGRQSLTVSGNQKAGHEMANEPILEAGYALFFEAMLNEPLLDLELLLAMQDDSKESSTPNA